MIKPSLESLFFRVLEDLKDHLEYLTLVGGWVPYIYRTFLWKRIKAKLITTVDIDFGFGEIKGRIHPKTIFDRLSALDYSEHHLEIDKMYPVVLYKRDKIPIDFITFPEIQQRVIEKFIGREININKISKFDFLLKNRIAIDVKSKNLKSVYKVYCPRPSAFLYQKGATFVNREDEQKQAKDLYYIYFILRYAPNLDSILKEVIQFKEESYFKNILENFDNYFERKSGKGCLMVEKENGPDEYIDDLRQDIFDRFKRLRGLF